MTIVNRWFFGLLVLLAGVVGLLNNFNVLDVSIGTLISDFWPVLLIIWGLSIIFEAKGFITGTILIGLGVLFLGQNLHFFTVDFSWLWGVFWPVIIILIGLRILLAHKGGESKTAVMGSVEKKHGPWKLESSSYQAIMGGVELDLRQAQITEKVTNLEITVIIGGIEITVPADLAVSCQGSVILGGLEMLGKQSGGVIANLKAEQGDLAQADKVVKINCHAIMGGIEIKK